MEALKLEVENILQLHKLHDNPAYLELIHQKKFSKLVLALYEDDTIVERAKIQDKQWPDINSAANEIAKAVDDPKVVDLAMLKYQLLDQWLPDKSATSGSSMDETMTNFNLLQSLRGGQQQLKCDESEDHYWRCVYILQGFAQENQAEGCEYLFQMIFSPDSNRTVHHKLRALKCLLSVIDSQTLENAFGRSIEDLEKRFQSLFLVAKLETLNLPYHSVEALDACDKLSLIESILRNSGHLPEGNHNLHRVTRFG